MVWLSSLVHEMTLSIEAINQCQRAHFSNRNHLNYFKKYDDRWKQMFYCHLFAHYTHQEKERETMIRPLSCNPYAVFSSQQISRSTNFRYFSFYSCVLRGFKKQQHQQNRHTRKIKTKSFTIYRNEGHQYTINSGWLILMCVSCVFCVCLRLRVEQANRHDGGTLIVNFQHLVCGLPTDAAHTTIAKSYLTSIKRAHWWLLIILLFPKRRTIAARSQKITHRDDARRCSHCCIGYPNNYNLNVWKHIDGDWQTKWHPNEKFASKLFLSASNISTAAPTASAAVGTYCLAYISSDGTFNHHQYAYRPTDGTDISPQLVKLNRKKRWFLFILLASVHLNIDLYYYYYFRSMNLELRSDEGEFYKTIWW